jgi:hypothetical protein
MRKCFVYSNTNQIVVSKNTNPAQVITCFRGINHAGISGVPCAELCFKATVMKALFSGVGVRKLLYLPISIVSSQNWF